MMLLNVLHECKQNAGLSIEDASIEKFSELDFFIDCEKRCHKVYKFQVVCNASCSHMKGDFISSEEQRVHCVNILITIIITSSYGKIKITFIGIFTMYQKLLNY